MDLLERNTANRERHPWETARVEAIETILRRLPFEVSSVLDAGCGDGYLLGELQRSFGFARAYAYDVHLTPALLGELQYPGVRFVRELTELGQPGVDVVLLLDVLEHVEQPAELLEQLATDVLASHGWIIVTVPAFQALFTQHDRDLRHSRRYARSEIAGVAEAAGLEVVAGGYLFASLLAPRGARVLWERFLQPRLYRGRARRNVDAGETSIGTGGWRAPQLLTRAIHRALCWDNRLCLAAHQRGLSLPGLSAWLICRRPC